MRILTIILFLLISLQAFAGNCNKKLVRSEYDNGSVYVTFELSNDGITRADNCQRIGQIRPETNPKVCEKVALEQNFSCGQVIKDIANVPSTDLTSSTYIEIKSCWACRE